MAYAVDIQEIGKLIEIIFRCSNLQYIPISSYGRPRDTVDSTMNRTGT